jgi:predicted nucleic acid-binding Zn ribbon protein
MERTCPECGIKIMGRVDKKFCSDGCRNAYNNRLKRDDNNIVRNVNNTLKKNRRIIAEFTPEGKAKVHKDKLMEQGFNFEYFTNTYTTKVGTVYYFCYEYGYLPLENDFYALVKREER